jgi:hypothetical protein
MKLMEEKEENFIFKMGEENKPEEEQFHPGRVTSE